LSLRAIQEDGMDSHSAGDPNMGGGALLRTMIVAMATIVASCGSNPTMFQPYALVIEVVDAETREAITGTARVVVREGDYEEVFDSIGSDLIMAGARPGVYDVQVRHDGYQDWLEEVAVEEKPSPWFNDVVPDQLNLVVELERT
jgi:hypothetical protein